MSLQTRLEEDLKIAMRGRDALRRSVIRYLRAETHNEEIARRAELDAAAVIGVLSKQAQQRRDSMEMFAQGGRQDMVDKEKAELAIVLEYLPAQMSADEIANLVRCVIDEMGAGGPRDKGTVMGRVMPQVSGKAEGRQVSAIAAGLLRDLAG